jgi:hypothetical protein
MAPEAWIGVLRCQGPRRAGRGQPVAICSVAARRSALMSNGEVCVAASPRGSVEISRLGPPQSS